MFKHNGIKDYINIFKKELVKSHDISENFILIKTNKDDSETIWLIEPVTEKQAKFIFTYSVKGSQKSKYFCFEVPNALINEINIPQIAEVKTINSNKIHSFVNFKMWSNDVINFMRNSITYYVEHFEPSDKFGCCGKYVECSNAKRCLHDNLFYARACYYRKNLEAGRIFYGDNKNI